MVPALEVGGYLPPRGEAFRRHAPSSRWASDRGSGRHHCVPTAVSGCPCRQCDRVRVQPASLQLVRNRHFQIQGYAGPMARGSASRTAARPYFHVSSHCRTDRLMSRPKQSVATRSCSCTEETPPPSRPIQASRRQARYDHGFTPWATLQQSSATSIASFPAAGTPLDGTALGRLSFGAVEREAFFPTVRVLSGCSAGCSCRSGRTPSRPAS